MNKPGHAPRRYPLDDPFQRLDDDWAALCRRHRHSTVVRRWARSEPVLAGTRSLADVVPPPGRNRWSTFAALLRLSAGGDELATRALLQLLVPGLVRLAAGLRCAVAGPGEVEAEVVSAAWLLLERLRSGQLRCRTPGFLLRSARRSVLERRHGRRRCVEEPFALHIRPADVVTDTGACIEVDDPVNLPPAPSAEDEALAGPLATDALQRAVAAGDLSSLAAELVWSCAVDGDGVPTVAAHCGTPAATAYRLRHRAHHTLRDILADAS